ncbi:aminodeoxychorismate synthase, component I [Bacillus mangrovi]|uniref:Aminodeoxychorismate synthase, component I n=1 Tax=Metabacillus mangrovi TaxID=1491830 RepID=A0A7X2V6H3_9BACI|nr:aminodeoxychorismate synthase, component I [Metabacillus mangrovi]MTH55231.1 aminodeoxychorismate synthase, component I [Metabacillus mangrovi]
MKMYPHHLKITGPADFFGSYKWLTENEPYHALLESGRGGRYTIAGIAPAAVLSSKGAEIQLLQGGERQTFQSDDPLQWLQDYMARIETEQNPELPDFQGGAIGFISYDAVRHFEKLPELGEDDLETPDYFWMLFHELAILDHQKDELYIIVLDQSADAAAERLSRLKSRWLSPAKKSARMAPEPLKPKGHFETGEFKKAVERIKEYIAAGDVFQVNLSVRQGVPLAHHPIEIYERLRTINPSPYMSYIETPDFQIASASPELLIKKSGSKLSTRPIAGTRSRGENEEEDERLVQELIDNEKERAEHVMLVDLERNDLGRVCRYGTVEVNEFMAIEKYSHVMHIVSNVQGEMEDGKKLSDVVRAVFPGGTITGAPKIRTMEIIEELEPKRRGIYTGSVGWIDFNGDLELNIVIRTLFAKDGAGYIQAGAGIVIDSNPDYEYKESLKKAAAVLKAAAEQSEAEQIKR